MNRKASCPRCLSNALGSMTARTFQIPSHVLNHTFSQAYFSNPLLPPLSFLQKLRLYLPHGDTLRTAAVLVTKHGWEEGSGGTFLISVDRDACPPHPTWVNTTVLHNTWYTHKHSSREKKRVHAPQRNSARRLYKPQLLLVQL